MFTGMDLAQIEARLVGYCAGARDFLNLFTTSDPYCTYGRSLFGHEITKKDLIKRTASKASLLANGFAGGIGAGQRVAENYKMNFEELALVILPTASYQELAEASRNYQYYRDKNPPKPLSERHGMAVDISKQRYRAAFPEIPLYWDILEMAFLRGGQAGPVNVEVRGGGLRVVTLPSGRQMFYHGVGITSDGSYYYQGRHGRVWLWKGQLMENVAQAINEDVSCWYKIRANRTIAPVVHHVYDEFTLEHESNRAAEVLEKLKALTATRPGWLTHNGLELPLGFDYWQGERYGK